jgi:hypothetical protein
MAFRERPYYPAPRRTNINAPPVPTLPGSSNSIPFLHGGYAPRAVPRNTIHSYPTPAFGSSSNSSAVSHEPGVTSYPPATSAATSSAPPFHAEVAASSRHLGHVALGSSGSARSRRLRDSYHAFHPLIIEENNLRGSAAEVDVDSFLVIMLMTSI